MNISLISCRRGFFHHQRRRRQLHHEPRRVAQRGGQLAGVTRHAATAPRVRAAAAADAAGRGQQGAAKVGDTAQVGRKKLTCCEDIIAQPRATVKSVHD